MSDKLTFVIPGKPQYITIARLAAACAADSAGFNVEEIEDIKNAVGEACKNISCHGSEGCAEKYQVECLVEEGKIEIFVTDISDSHKLQKLEKPCLDCPNEGDLGLYVIKSLMSSVELIEKSDCKKAIKMTKAKQK